MYHVRNTQFFFKATNSEILQNQFYNVMYIHNLFFSDVVFSKLNNFSCGSELKNSKGQK